MSIKGVSFVWLSPTLTRIGKKLGIDAHFFAKNSFFVMLGHVLAILRGIVTGYLVARFFEKEMYGEYLFIQSVTGMLSLFTLTGLATSVSRAWSRGDAFSMERITKHHFCVCVVASFILLGCLPFLESMGRKELWPLFVAAAVLFPLPPIAMVRFGGYTVGRARFDVSLKASVVWSTLLIAATLAIIVFRQSALLLFVAATAIPPLVYLYFSRNIRPPKEEGTKNTDGIIKYGWNITFSTLPVEAVWYVDQLLISKFLGLNQLATFAVALLIPEQVKMLLKQFIPITFAKQAQGKDSRERRAKLMKFVLAGMAIFAVGISIYIALCPFIIPLLFPNYDSGQVTLVTGIVAASLITQPVGLLGQYLEAQKMIRAIWLTNIVATVGFAVALVTLIPTMGLVGAALARTAFRVLHAGACWWFVLTAPVRDAE